MNEPKPASLRTTRRVLDRHYPTLHQGLDSAWDFPGAISDDMDWGFDPHPPLYYWCLQDDRFYWLGFGVYHRYDPASLHQHDFEGGLFRICRVQDLVLEVATISHLNIRFTRGIRNRQHPDLAIEAKGHGIDSQDTAPLPSYIPRAIYNNFTIFQENNLLGRSFQNRWADVQALFGRSVCLPDRWGDVRLENYCRRRRPSVDRKRVRSVRGLLWTRPDILWKIADRRGRFVGPGIPPGNG